MLSSSDGGLEVAITKKSINFLIFFINKRKKDLKEHLLQHTNIKRKNIYCILLNTYNL